MGGGCCFNDVLSSDATFSSKLSQSCKLFMRYVPLSHDAYRSLLISSIRSTPRVGSKTGQGKNPSSLYHWALLRIFQHPRVASRSDRYLQTAAVIRQKPIIRYGDFTDSTIRYKKKAHISMRPVGLSRLSSVSKRWLVPSPAKECGRTFF